jgi:2-phosphosulfolactate phosphatase
MAFNSFMKNKIETVLTPALLPLFEIRGSTVVIIDILRATSTICVALNNGVKSIKPVATPEESIQLKSDGFIAAAERNAIKVEGCDLGNSPFEYMQPDMVGKQVALTTTNGTKALQMAHQMQAEHIIIGSFLNLQAVINFLIKSTGHVVLLCSGWKDRCNIEDTLFAGAVAHNLLANNFTHDCDSTSIATQLYLQHQHNLEALVRTSNHARRFKSLQHQTDDVAYCMQQNIIHKVPIYKNGEIIFELAEETM